jgi:hypothetical protein
VGTMTIIGFWTKSSNIAYTLFYSEFMLNNSSEHNSCDGTKDENARLILGVGVNLVFTQVLWSVCGDCGGPWVERMLTLLKYVILVHMVVDTNLHQ